MIQARTVSMLSSQIRFNSHQRDRDSLAQYEMKLTPKFERTYFSHSSK